MTLASGTYLGKGLYSLADAARLVGERDAKIRRWLRPKDDLIHRAFEPSERAISFAELMEIHFIKMFRDEGVSLQAIRKAAKAAEKQFGTQYPFAVKRFDTDGRTIFVTLADDETDTEMVKDLRRGQYVFANILRPFFRKLEYNSTEDISRFWPLGKRRRVVLDPCRQFGQPIDNSTGMRTRILYEAVMAGGGQSVAKVADWYGVPQSAVRAAVEFEKSLKT
jgi:uncharacterized protein (DUF433 family)